MIAGLRDGEGQLALEQSRADQASAALGGNRMDGVDVGVAGAEGDDALGAAARGLDQPVAVRRVVGNDRDPAGLEAFEDLGLGIGDRLLRAEFSMCAGAMAVMSATCGRTCAVNARISPALFMPISSTANRRRAASARGSGDAGWLL